MSVNNGDRLWQNKAVTIAIVPSRRNRAPEALARLWQSCRKLSMSGSCGWSFPIRCEMQACSSSDRKRGRGVCALTRGNECAASADHASLAEIRIRRVGESLTTRVADRFPSNSPNSTRLELGGRKKVQNKAN